MKPEAQRIAIGELHGMKWYVVASPIRSARRFLYWPEMIVGNEGIEPATMDEPIANLGWDWFRFLPRYTEDLGAAYDAAKELLLAPFSTPENDTMQGSIKLVERLRIFEDYLRLRTLGLGTMWRAEPLHVCEALLRAFGRWVE